MVVYRILSDDNMTHEARFNTFWHLKSRIKNSYWPYTLWSLEGKCYDIEGA